MLTLNFNKDLPVSNCTATKIEFPAFKRRKIEAQFSGGDITSDGGVLLLRSIDQRVITFQIDWLQKYTQYYS